MYKRFFVDEILDDGSGASASGSLNKRKRFKKPEYVKKHTLDSDEDDSDDDKERYNVLNENDIEGEEDDTIGMDGEVTLTPFNMKEELEEGHFDMDGHYQWKKNTEIKDNWLDNIDWNKMKSIKEKKPIVDENRENGPFDELVNYTRILQLMKPGETINKTLQRLGGKKLSSLDRWRRKKSGIVDTNAQLVIELTEVTNEILTETGNMNVYEETYDMIKRKIDLNTKFAIPPHDEETASAAMKTNDDLDMYADDFDTKQKEKLKNLAVSSTAESKLDTLDDCKLLDKNVPDSGISWEFKWKQDDDDIHGPFCTEQMQAWVTEGYFKEGVYVKKTGENTPFYTSNRIDFELYL